MNRRDETELTNHYSRWQRKRASEAESAPRPPAPSAPQIPVPNVPEEATTMDSIPPLDAGTLQAMQITIKESVAGAYSVTNDDYLAPPPLTDAERIAAAAATVIKGDEPLVAEDTTDDEPLEPVLRRTSRTVGDTASRIGFVLGDSSGDVRFGIYWTWQAFHLSHPAIVGRIEASIFLHHKTDTVRIQIHNAQGELLLATEAKFINTGLVRAEFDEVRLGEAGDYLIVFHVGGGAASGGQGVYLQNNVGVFQDAVPERPLLDQLIRRGSPHKVAAPQWRFFAR